MRNAPVRAAGGALPEAVSLSRRSVFGGLAASPMLALPALAAQEPASQKEIAQRVRDLAGEMSELLAAVDSGGWKIEVKPALSGVWRYELERTDLDATVRLQQALTAAARALNELQPGAWRVGCNVPMGFATITNDEWRRFERPADVAGGRRGC